MAKRCDSRKCGAVSEDNVGTARPLQGQNLASKVDKGSNFKRSMQVERCCTEAWRYPIQEVD